jgi:hypothetical protein
MKLLLYLCGWWGERLNNEKQPLIFIPEMGTYVADGFSGRGSSPDRHTFVLPYISHKITPQM